VISASDYTLLLLLSCIMDDSLQMVEDAVPGKHLSEMEERRQELIGKSSHILNC